MCDLVRSDTVEPGGLNGRLDQVLVRLVEIEDAAGFVISLLPEAHDDEAGLEIGCLVHAGAADGLWFIASSPSSLETTLHHDRNTISMIGLGTRKLSR